MYQENYQEKQEFSFKSLFVPLTTMKAIHWIIFIGLVIYANMLFNGFVWDDISYLLGNNEVHNFNFFYYFGTTLYNNTGQYRALSEMYFALLYSFFGTSPFFYHLVQLIIHIINTIFVFLLFKKFFKNVLSFLLALIFLIHPMQVESVSYISAAGSVLFFLFGIIALYLFEKREYSLVKTVIIFLLLLVSFLAKESGILFVFMMGLYIYLFNKINLKRMVLLNSAVLISYFLIRFGIGEVYFGTRPLIPIARLDILQRFISIPQILLYYFKTFVLPLDLSIDQQWVVTSPNVSSFFAPLAILIALFLFLFTNLIKLIKAKKTEWKPFLFFFLWTVLGLGLYAQIFPLDMTVADRWIYFPIVGILGLIGCLISPYTNSKRQTNFIISIFIFVIVIYSGRTIIRNMDWVNPQTLYSHDTKSYTNYLIENDYAQNLLLAGDLPSALIHQQNSVRLFAYEQNLLNLADLYNKVGDTVKAEYYYKEALQSKSYIPWKYKHIINTYIQYSSFLLKKNEAQKALAVSNEGIQDYNDFQARAYLLYIIALADYKLNKFEDAKNAAQEAYRLMQNQATQALYNNLTQKNSIDVQLYLSAIQN